MRALRGDPARTALLEAPAQADRPARAVKMASKDRVVHKGRVGRKVHRETLEKATLLPIPQDIRE
jgi:hypothetical protein